MTQQKCSEDRSQLSTLILENLANAICITDRNGYIIWINPAFTRLTGFESDEVVGKPLSLLGSAKHDDPFYAELWTTITSGLSWHGEIVERRKSGELYEEEMTITPVLNDAKQIRYFVAAGQDITKRKMLEEQLREARNAEAIGQLAGGIAHDFNSVLMVISSYAELLEASVVKERQKKYTSQILGACKRAASLIEQLLAFSRQQVQQKRILRINDLIRDSRDMLSGLAGSDVRIKLNLADDVPSVTADPTQMVQLLMNLTANARDSMINAGMLSFSTSLHRVIGNSCSNPTMLKSGDYALLTISDSGVGVDELTKGHLFEPYFKTSLLAKRAGLRLASVYGIVKQSDGFIDVDSNLGVGTTFKIYLPGVQDVSTQDQRIPVSISLRPCESILLVEDEPSLRDALAERLRNAGYRVREASSGESAVALAVTDPSFDLLLSDLELPDLNGTQVYERICESLGEKRAIFMSAYADRNLTKHCVLYRHSIFLKKPFAFSSLLESIETLCRSSKI